MNVQQTALAAELDRRILHSICQLESGQGVNNWVIIQIPGELGGRYKVTGTVERLQLLRKQVKGIFRAQPRRARWAPARPEKHALKDFIESGDFDNAREYAHLTGQTEVHLRSWTVTLRSERHAN